MLPKRRYSPTPIVPRHATAYVIVQRDYHDSEDDAECKAKVRGVYLKLPAANAAAERNAGQEAESARDGGRIYDSKNTHGGYVGECCFNQDDRDLFKIEVEPHRIKNAPVRKKIYVSPNAAKTTPFGPMITIPVGKLHGLRRFRFAFAATLSTMTKSIAKAVVEMYGGVNAREINTADYVVIGEDPSDEEVNVIAGWMNHVEQLDEKEFFDLLRTGVPSYKRLRLIKDESEDEEDGSEDDEDSSEYEEYSSEYEGDGSDDKEVDSERKEGSAEERDSSEQEENGSENEDGEYEEDNTRPAKRQRT